MAKDKKITSDKTEESHDNVLMDFGSVWSSVIPSNDATNMFISGLGIIFDHYVAIPNVIGESEIGDLRRSFGEEHSSQFNNDKKYAFIENGFLYKYAGQVFGIFQGNNKEFRSIAAGLYSQSGAFVTFNRYYRASNKYASFAEYDKLIPCVTGKEFFSVNWEKTRVSPTGINRLQFPACEIEYVVDSTGAEYFEGKDFKLEKGYLRWIDTNSAVRPGIDPDSQKGRLISIRYKYKPTYYVKSLAHDIRCQPTFDDITGDLVGGLSTDADGNVQYKSGPTSVSLVADWVFLDRRTAENDKIDAQLEDDDSENGNIGPR